MTDSSPMQVQPVKVVRDYLAKELLKSVETSDSRADTELDFPFEAEGLLRDAIRERATDIHLDAQMRGVMVRLRIDGRLLDCVLLDKAAGQRLNNQFKVMGQLSPANSYVPEEGRCTREVNDRSLDLRISHAPCLQGEKLSIRILQHQDVPTSMSQLGLHFKPLEHIQDWLDDIFGMLLVAGPTGSGKSTTLYTLLHYLKLHEKSIVSVEDPVEYQIDGITHIQVDRRHGLDFAESVQSVLRLDPDYIMMGEIRDSASAKAAITAAASGRVLLSTIHSRDAVGAVDTLRNYDLKSHELSANLVMVLAQRLVRTLCPECRKFEAPNEDEKRWLAVMGRDIPKRTWHAVGCASCRDLGYLGRTGVFEVWRINADDYGLIMQGAHRKQMYEHLREKGHAFMIDDGLAKVSEGVTTLYELKSLGGLAAFQANYEAEKRL